MDNREKLRQLLKSENITQAKGAELIAAATQRPCGERTVRSWLNDPEKESSRRCPDWAVDALTRAIRYMRIAVERRGVQPPSE